MKTYKSFVIAFLLLVLLTTAVSIVPIVIVDPCFHYHRPLKCLSYTLHNERMQNDGITRHFDYDALITGTSMTENFKTSEADRVFGLSFIKVPYSGGTFKEIDDGVRRAISYNKELTLVIRCLDYWFLNLDKDIMRTDMGNFPTYLYDRNPFNDVAYVFNREILYWSVTMLLRYVKTRSGGVDDFDSYANWMSNCTFGSASVLQDRGRFAEPSETRRMTEKERRRTVDNITQNVTSLARENPQCTFLYFFSPYSIAWWGSLYEQGDIERRLEIERTAVELILECDNIRLYSFNTEFDWVTDLDNYNDACHYGEWINSRMLVCMKEGKGMLTKDNYLSYLAAEREFYMNFDYNSLFAVGDDYEGGQRFP